VPRAWTDFCYDLSNRNGTWDLVQVVSLCSSGSLAKVARELAKYKLDLVDVQRLGATKGALLGQGIIFFLCQRKRKSSNGNRLFIHNRIISRVNRIC
jgi:hypothetical protein